MLGISSCFGPVCRFSSCVLHLFSVCVCLALLSVPLYFKAKGCRTTNDQLWLRALEDPTLDERIFQRDLVRPKTISPPPT